MNDVKYGLAGVYADDTKISKVMPQTNSLTYRGYAVQDLALKCNFEEVAYLIWHGELPTKQELNKFKEELSHYRKLEDDEIELAKKLSRTAHPMDRLRTLVSYVGQKDSNIENTKENLLQKSYYLFEKIALFVAMDQRLMRGQDIIHPKKDLSFAENFLFMCFGEVPNKDIVKCFDISLTLYAEHSFNASTFCARVVASTLSDIYSAVTAAIGTLKGPLHGGANEAVMEVLEEIENPDNVETWLMDAFAKKRLIMGFGHRVYKGGDSRVPTMTEAYKKMVATINNDKAQNIWKISEKLSALMIEKKNIHPNLDFPAGPSYYLMGFDIPLFTPIFVAARITGWSAHVIEQLENNKLIRPLSNYVGHEQREVVEIEKR